MKFLQHMGWKWIAELFAFCDVCFSEWKWGRLEIHRGWHTRLYRILKTDADTNDIRGYMIYDYYMIWYDTLFIVNYSWYYMIWFVIFVLPLVVLPELALFLASLHLPSSWTGSWTMVKRLDWNSSKATKCIIWTWSDLGKSACPYPVLFGMQNDAHAVTCFVSQLIPIYYEKRSEWENMRSRSRSRSVEILAIKLETCARPRFKCSAWGVILSEQKVCIMFHTMVYVIWCFFRKQSFYIPLKVFSNPYFWVPDAK